MNQSKQIIVNGSAHNIPLPDGMVHTVVTSPPYYSLRRYQGAQEVDWPIMEYRQLPGQIQPSPVSAMRCALGLEPTPEAYIGHLVLCFREVMRVLRDDGVCWVVVGDDYTDGQLQMTPHRLALALQADGWLVRNDPPWHKLAPMPESVSGWRWERCKTKVHQTTTPALLRHGDRSEHGNPPHGGDIREHPDRTTWRDCPGCEKCAEHGGYVLRRGSWRHTRAHETVLMLARSMGYYADQERVREDVADYERKGGEMPWVNSDGSRSPRTSDTLHQMSTSGRNPRSVLTPRPESYSGAHYAVYPRTLISPLLQATAPTRVCPVCFAPWCPVVEREFIPQQDVSLQLGVRGHDGQKAMCDDGSNRWQGFPRGTTDSTTVAHRPTCSHEAEPVPGWVLDPFVGSGTTLEVCRELGVNGVGLDISPQYLDDHAKPRIRQTPSGALETLPLFEGLT